MRAPPSWLNRLPKASPPNTITLRIRALICEFWGDTNIQWIRMGEKQKQKHKTLFACYMHTMLHTYFFLCLEFWFWPWLCCCCSIDKSCQTLCDPIHCSIPGFPILHYLPELTETHVHWVSDAIQPSHPLLPPSPPVLNLSQHQGLFQWVGSITWAFIIKYHRSGSQIPDLWNLNLRRWGWDFGHFCFTSSTIVFLCCEVWETA